MSRQIVLDTETTGLEVSKGHRIIEIGCVELDNRSLTGKTYHQYIQPNRKIDEGAIKIHGITNDFLTDKPKFNEIVHDFMNFIKGAELIIHNAPFDVGFINHELTLLNQQGQDWNILSEYCKITDSLALARKKHPAQKNNLNILCKRYYIDNSQRNLHGALLDAQLLAEVFLAMTGGQTNLLPSKNSTNKISNEIRRVTSSRENLVVILPTLEETQAHKKNIELINKCLY
jgi:DNA polymerase-3 subunit epsilon